MSLGGVEPMLQSHIGNGLHVGLMEPQLQQLLSLDEQYIGKKDTDAGRTVLTKALTSQDK